MLDSILRILLQKSFIDSVRVKLSTFKTNFLLLNIFNASSGTQSSSFKLIQDMEASMATFVSQINDRLSVLEKRMDKIEPNRVVENKQTHYPSPENAGT